MALDPEPGDYAKVSSGKGKPAMKCCLCEEILPLRSNAGVAEELDRLVSYLDAKPAPSCPNPACENRDRAIADTPDAYVHYGVTGAGTPRWRCNACRKIFSVGGSPTKKQRITHKNREVFALLMNKSPMNRMVEITGLDPKTLYGKIDFIHRQCLAFAASRERQLTQGMVLPKMYVAVDRQSFVVNWSNRKDRRNVQLNAIASADLDSGYVFGMNLNFDGELDPDEVDARAIALGDYSSPAPYRKYARVWLKPDYDESVAASAVTAAKKVAKALEKARAIDELTGEISAEYASAMERDDVEDSEEKDKDTALPTLGMQVHEQYTLHAHFLALSLLLANAEKVRVYMDQDSGFRAGFMSGFHQRVRDRTADAFYVKVLKNATIDKKDSVVRKSKAIFKEYQAAHPKLKPYAVAVLMVIDEMKRMATLGQWDDRWLTHPLPNKGEPDKRVCWLTNLGGYPEEQVARLYLKASLHSVDRFFMQARRRLSLAERGFPSASSDRRIWHGYSAYKPQNLGKMLEIFRVFYNYCSVGQDKQTPAMRMGLARGPVKLEEVLCYVE